MNIQSVGSLHSSIYSLDEILQDINETFTEKLLDNEKTYQNYKAELNEELKATDRVWLEFHAGLCRHFGKAAKSILYRIVKSSVGHPENSIAAANAITILKIMKVSFSCLDLRGVHISGADLSNAILDRAGLSDANLENVNLSNASLNYTNMSKVNLKYAKFDVPIILVHKDKVHSSVASNNTKYLVSEDKQHMYFWYLPDKSCIKVIEKPDESCNQYPTCLDKEHDQYPLYKDEDFTKVFIVKQKIFTPDGRFIFIYDGERNIDIYSLDNFKHIRKFVILDKKIEFIFFSFSSNGMYFIAYYPTRHNIKETGYTTCLKIWRIQKTENNFLNINLIGEANTLYNVGRIHFSKKIPIFYCLREPSEIENKNEESLRGPTLSIWNIKKLSEIAHIPNIVEGYRFSDEEIRTTSWVTEIFSLDTLDTYKENEELLFIAFGRSIYSIYVIFKKNEQNWSLTSFKTAKIIDEIDVIYNMNVLIKTHELIYVCNNAVCIYSISNNQYIGKYRLYDINLERLPVSFDETNVYINDFHRVVIHPLEALKNNKYISYEMDSIASCFSLDMSTIISISNSSYMAIYDTESGNLLKSSFLQKFKSYTLNKSIKHISFSPNTQYIIMGDDYDGLRVINTKNEEVYLEANVSNDTFIFYNNSEYIAYIGSKNLFTEKKLIVYKTNPSMQCIGEFSFDGLSTISQIAISTDFRNFPKVALLGENPDEVFICNFVFKDKVLERLTLKELLVEKNEVLKFIFSKDDSELIIICKKRIIIWNIEKNTHEKYTILADCAGISYDGSLIIYYNWSQYDQDTSNHQLCLWSIIQKKPVIIQKLSLAIIKLQISPDNRYIIGTTNNGSMYVWKILENSFRLLWRTSHNLQTQGLILSGNNLEKDVEEDLIAKMGALKIADK